MVQNSIHQKYNRTCHPTTNLTLCMRMSSGLLGPWAGVEVPGGLGQEPPIPDDKGRWWKMVVGKSLTELLTWKKAMRRTFIIQVSYHPTRPLHWQPKPQRLNPSHHPDAEEMGDLGNFLMAPNSRISRQLRLIVFAEDDAESPEYQS